MKKLSTYARGQWITLNRHIEYGNLDIDNNLAERVLRIVANGATRLESVLNRCLAIGIFMQGIESQIFSKQDFEKQNRKQIGNSE